MSWIKTIFLIFAALIVLAAGGIYYKIKKTFSEENIQRVVRGHMRRHFPHAQANIGPMEVIYGTTTTLKVESFSLVTKNQEVLLSGKQFSLVFPWSTLLFVGGTVKVKVSDVQGIYEEQKDSSNWKTAMASPDKPLSSEKNDDQVVPAFLLTAHLDIVFEKGRFLYRSQSGIEITFKEGKIQSFGIEREAVHDLKLAVKTPNQTRFDAALEGEFPLKSFVMDGKWEINTVVNFSSVFIPAYPYISDFKTNFKLVLNPDGVLAGTARTQFSQGKLSLDILWEKDMVRLSKIDLDRPLEGVFKEWPSVPFRLQGEISLHKGKLNPNLTFSLAKWFKGEFRGENLLGRGVWRSDKGEMHMALDGKLDLNGKAPLHKKISHYNLAVRAEGVKFPMKLWQKWIYENQNRPILLPQGEITLLAKNIQLDRKTLSAKGALNTNLNMLTVKSCDFQSGEGGGKLQYNSKWYQNRIERNFKLDLNKMSVGLLVKLAPGIGKKVFAPQGALSGNIAGDWNRGESFGYKIKADLKLLWGKLTGWPMNPYREQLSRYLTLWPTFRLGKLRGVFDNERYYFSELIFEGWGETDIRANGYVYPYDKNKDSFNVSLSGKNRRGKFFKLRRP